MFLDRFFLARLSILDRCCSLLLYLILKRKCFDEPCNNPDALSSHVTVCSFLIERVQSIGRLLEGRVRLSFYLIKYQSMLRLAPKHSLLPSLIFFFFDSAIFFKSHIRIVASSTNYSAPIDEMEFSRVNCHCSTERRSRKETNLKST